LDQVIIRGMDRKVFVFGAGATKECGGPLTNEILPSAFASLPERMPSALGPLNDFLCEVFHLNSAIPERKPNDYPSLPPLLTLVDTALARGEDVTAAWTRERLPTVRAAIEHAIFLSLAKLSRVSRNYYHELFMAACVDEAGPTAISLNYDTLVDRAMIELSAWIGSGRMPDYGCALTMPRSRESRFGRLLKLHGSVDWLHCATCSEIRCVTWDFDIFKHEIPKAFIDARTMDKPDLACRRCRDPIRACIVAPTQRKTYGNNELNEIWRNAEQALRAASHVYFVGYSLPEDDVEIAVLLIRSLEQLSPARITVIEYDAERRSAENHPVGRRYISLFGEVNWHTCGFASWLKLQSQQRWPE